MLVFVNSKDIFSHGLLLFPPKRKIFLLPFGRVIGHLGGKGGVPRHCCEDSYRLHAW